mgnify:CR=1 FL=1
MRLGAQWLITIVPINQIGSGVGFYRCVLLGFDRPRSTCYRTSRLLGLSCFTIIPSTRRLAVLVFDAPLHFAVLAF